jgi:23S rRNA U2552 (ribose-2'-O)-methylase RlmE/FtsJ
MEVQKTFESFDNTFKPWTTLKMYERSEYVDDYQYKMNEVKHENSEEENQLYQYRCKINRYEKKWDYYKKLINPYEWVYTQKKYNNFPESICFLKPLSRSYFKMIEMIDVIHFFKDTDSIRSAHVCEGPGGFIEALYDRAQHMKKKIEVSVAMTLQSNKAPGWRNAAHLLKKHRTIRIIFGEDGTGDIITPANQAYYVDYVVHQGGKIDIFTADGGFDFSDNYQKQEEQVFPLLLASVKIGFEVLKVGGVFILKLFDFCYRSTTDLLYLLSQHFEEWTLYKPCMSRPCNPEHYFIGKRFTGCSVAVLNAMVEWAAMLERKEPLDSLFCTPYSESFQENLKKLQKQSFQLQLEYLKRVFDRIAWDEKGCEDGETWEDSLVAWESFKSSGESFKSSGESFKSSGESFKSPMYSSKSAPSADSSKPAPLFADSSKSAPLFAGFFLKSPNEKISYEWCNRFNMPVFSYRRHLIEASHNVPPTSSQ